MTRVAQWLGWIVVAVAVLRAPPAAAQDSLRTGDLPPPGLGTLSQDQISIRLSAGDLDLRILPLDERVLRLLARDAYESLHGLVVSRQAAIDSAARQAGVGSPGLVLVSFFARRADTRFDPSNVALLYRNQFYRPAAILPFTGNFSGRQLDVRQQATGLYLFDLPLPVFETFDVSYDASHSSGWNDVLPRLERERSRVMARWQTTRGDSTSRP